MVSQNQTGANDTTAKNEAHRYLATDMEIAAMLRGIESQERILMYWNTVNDPELDIQYRDRRRKLIKERMAYLKERNA